MTQVYFYNTLTKRKEPFSPQNPNEVGMYTCGPTVYEYASIGNMRAYLFSDILKRTLQHNGYNVKLVMNITDVGHLVSDADEGEDKVLESAKKEGKTPEEIAKHYTEAFLKDTRRLNIEAPSVLCYATEHIGEMISMVEEIMDKGYAYETSDGVYFDIDKFPGYGRLSGVNLSEQMAGARVEINRKKKNPADFALWKKAPKEHIMKWESPWGTGYPGWHIECSAMGRKYLGDTFDIHTGGIDHIPVHHENEIAQTWACTGQPAAAFWMHVEFLQVDGGKMSKSLGNTYTLDDLIDRNIEPLSFRYLCLGAHYRSKLNFTWEAVSGAQRGLFALRKAVQNSLRDSDDCTSEQKQRFMTAFTEAINDDLNTPRALAVLWEAAKSGLGRGLGELARVFDQVLALDLADGPSDRPEAIGTEELPSHVQALLEERSEARQKRDWAKADALRDRLEELGYQVKDTPGGFEVTKKKA